MSKNIFKIKSCQKINNLNQNCKKNESPRLINGSFFFFFSLIHLFTFYKKKASKITLYIFKCSDSRPRHKKRNQYISLARGRVSICYMCRIHLSLQNISCRLFTALYEVCNGCSYKWKVSLSTYWINKCYYFLNRLR